MFELLNKIALSIGPLQVTWYAVIILTGALTGTAFGYYHYGKRMGLNSDLVCEGLAIGLFLGILFARLYYVAFDASHGGHYDGFLDVIDPRSGGLAIHGAILAVVIYLPIWTKFRKIDLITLLEIAMPLIMFAQVVGRWGNFVNGEAYGPETTYEFLHSFLPDFIVKNMFCDGAYHHPTFLYEGVANLIGLTTYQIVRKYWKKILVGDGVSFYLIWYGMVRFCIEILRTDALIIGNTGIKIAQVVSVSMIVIGIALIVLRRVFKYRMTPCYDALYGENATLLLEPKKSDNNEE